VSVVSDLKQDLRRTILWRWLTVYSETRCPQLATAIYLLRRTQILIYGHNPCLGIVSCLNAGKADEGPVSNCLSLMAVGHPLPALSLVIFRRVVQGVVAVASVARDELENLAAHWAPMLRPLPNKEPHKLVLFDSLVSAETTDEAMVVLGRHVDWAILRSERTVQSAVTPVILSGIVTLDHTLTQLQTMLVTDVINDGGNLVHGTGLILRQVTLELFVGESLDVVVGDLQGKLHLRLEESVLGVVHLYLQSLRNPLPLSGGYVRVDVDIDMVRGSLGAGEGSLGDKLRGSRSECFRSSS